MNRTIIIGAGPAGMFAADAIKNRTVNLGFPNQVTILEMGDKMKDRICPNDPQCRCNKCDMLEGVGGAGGFSDGKSTFSLTRGTQMETLFHEKHEETLKDIRETLMHYSDRGFDFDPINDIPEEIGYAGFKMDSYSLNHLGSDGIQKFIHNHYHALLNSGVEIRTNTKVLEIHHRPNGEYAVSFVNSAGQLMKINGDNVIIASGLQGASWLESQAKSLNIPLSAGPAGFGIRFETPKHVMENLFELFYDFKLTYEYWKTSGLYGTEATLYRSFCCNREGFVVNENHRTLGIRNVNGHSYLDKTGRYGSDYSNCAIIAKIADFQKPQEGVRNIARMINGALGGSSAVQTAEDFLNGQASSQGDVARRTNLMAKPGIDIGKYMPGYIRQGFREFIQNMGKIMKDFVPQEAFVYAPEVKYYGWKFPVDFDTWQVNDRPGLYVVGNASGYLDSFISAALTGVIAANHINSKERR